MFGRARERELRREFHKERAEWAAERKELLDRIMLLCDKPVPMEYGAPWTHEIPAGLQDPDEPYLTPDEVR